MPNGTWPGNPVTSASRDGGALAAVAPGAAHTTPDARSTVLNSLICSTELVPPSVLAPVSPRQRSRQCLTNLATPCETSQTCGCVRALWSYDASACQTNVNPTLATCVPLACSVHTCPRPHGGYPPSMGRRDGRGSGSADSWGGGGGLANRGADRGAKRDQRHLQL